MIHCHYHDWLSTAPDGVRNLVRQWKADPCWDLYEADGFGDYADALYGIQMEHELDRLRDELDRHRAIRTLLAEWLTPPATETKGVVE